MADRLAPVGRVRGAGVVGSKDREWIRSCVRPAQGSETVVRSVDLFCGCGGMSLGLQEAARRQGAMLDIRLAVDRNAAACAVFKHVFPTAKVLAADLRDLFPGRLGDDVSKETKNLAEVIGPVDVLIGGPPCQGHSDLNNHTRRRDPKNGLYLSMARAAEILLPRLVLIENVAPVVSDSTDVVGKTTIALEKLGYSVHGEVLDLSRLGVPQTRRRFVLLASLEPGIDPVTVLNEAPRVASARTVRWAIGDLERRRPLLSIDTPSSTSEENKRRINYLFRNGLFDLPNAERPPCHRDEEHSYKSMYGRLRWDEPAQTITTGFGSMGQGRFVHPSQPRTLTAHEAARLQTFPDWFDWKLAGGRVRLAELIGNAVPPLMMVRLGSRFLPGLRLSSAPTKRVRGRPDSSSQEASRRMRAVRQSSTKPELELARELRSLGMRFAVDIAPVPRIKRRGDFVFKRERLVILVDGCFWHSCPEHGTLPKSNAPWWRDKLEMNRARDADTDRILRRAGFKVIRIWAHEDMTRAAKRVRRALDRRAVLQTHPTRGAVADSA